ncbi:hypothetical protein L6452_40017 [Arctium lappa]|uniref:Uncharacterized protein n=1 Tax=Arctium lappa TaxID=4217 RepID=A0ACB8XUE3_ARCLA|nr:hypothetical protein L6452_40017 [Arctium lappa]
MLNQDSEFVTLVSLISSVSYFFGNRGNHVIKWMLCSWKQIMDESEFDGKLGKSMNEIVHVLTILIFVNLELFLSWGCCCLL